MGERSLLVGGLSSVHDPLCVSALRGVGLPAVQLHARTDRGLRRARSLGNHGQCNPAHYIVGAVLEHAEASTGAGDFASRHAWLTIGSCGPCRLAAYRMEYQRVLEGAGLVDLPILTIEQLSFVAAGLPLRTGPMTLERRAADALMTAVVAGDVVAALGHRLRPYAIADSSVDALVDSSVRSLAGALENGSSLAASLAGIGAQAKRVARDHGRVLPRALLVGEPWTTIADGDPSYDLARRLEQQGVEVDAPLASDWLRYRIWEERRDAITGRSRSSPDRIAALDRADRRVRALQTRGFQLVGLPRRRLDLELLAALARPHYDPDVRGGSAHLEIGRALLAARTRTAHLVLSLKPFGCLPSSDLSDGVLAVVLRRLGHPGFLAVETTGDGDATLESRIDMAVHGAALLAADELDRACAAVGVDPGRAVELVAETSAADFPPEGPRAYACTAAELLSRLAQRDRDCMRRARNSSQRNPTFAT